MKKAILIGDSIRMGYQPVVKAQLSGLVDVWGPEANCGPTTRTLANFDEWVIGRKPDIVHINCGLHDTAREPGNPPGKFNRVEIEAYRKNVRAIFQRLLKDTAAKMVWALTTPVMLDRQQTFKQHRSNRTPVDVLNYNAVANAVAGELGVPIHDLHRVVMDGGMERLLSADGVHFTPEGYAALGKAVAEVIRKLA
ncbi:MAG: hypothetical protein HY360_18915 [Verrucomicrobia bacterium]|nr:hypothetical protein [Verrucomicrobiota bacterium]